MFGLKDSARGADVHHEPALRDGDVPERGHEHHPRGGVRARSRHRAGAVPVLQLGWAVEALGDPRFRHRRHHRGAPVRPGLGRVDGRRWRPVGWDRHGRRRCSCRGYREPFGGGYTLR